MVFHDKFNDTCFPSCLTHHRSPECSSCNCYLNFIIHLINKVKSRVFQKIKNKNIESVDFNVIIYMASELKVLS